MDSQGQEPGRGRHEHGYAMAGLLVSLGVMAVMLSVALPAWRQQMQREREAELVFRGEQYARAIGLYQRKYAGAFPPNVDLLVQQKFLRRKYRDPVANDEFRILYQTDATATSGAPTAQPGGRGLMTTPSASPASGTQAGAPRGTLGPQGGVVGVVSKSTQQSIRLYKGRNRYSEWQFVYTAVTAQPGAAPGASPRPGTPGGAAPRPGTPGGAVPRPGGDQPPSRPPFGPPGPGAQPEPPGGARRPL